MPSFTYFVYAPNALDFFNGTIRLDPDFDPEDDRRVVVLTDDDNTLDGDFTNNERGADGTQRGTVYQSDGTSPARIGGEYIFNDRIYAESRLTLSGSDGSVIEVYTLESDGIFIGYLPVSPLTANVDYTYTVSNVINDNELSGPYFDQYMGDDGTDPGEYTDENGVSQIEGAVVICFTPNSQVTTPQGARRIRDLEIGDQVLTRDRGYQSVRWIYRRTLTRAFLDANPHLAPVVFEKDALGPGRPRRRMKVSPQHRLLVQSHLSEMLFARGAVLAPAKGLINGTLAYQDRSGTPVSYVHILFDQHEVIEVDGVFSESYHPTERVLSTSEAALREELFQIFPELQQDPDAYGPTCYPAISVREARLLMA
ncbi:Hint domain-containing protein [Phaeobacter sp. B1627]|uniref:Hint domain-containing protein n=1 Tax=Phaeobacter sp. B1627 TaxID=2583809 RepID=UPI00111941B7|nr:Hint domain-containing protein [Phaeobacter sp. B1627]TNJ40187.1 Hint domain-containing protein [Phaeobacter sp. B1627]